MVAAYVILGRAKMGKSTTLKALTGALPERGYKITTITKSDGPEIKIWVEESAPQEGQIRSNGTEIKVWVEESAPQEGPLDWSRRKRPILPDEFIKQVNSSGCQHVLIPLRIKEPKFTSAPKDYMDAFTKVGWTIQPLVVLGEKKEFNETLPAGTPSPLFIKPKSTTPEKIASKIRERWGWR